MKTTRTSRYKNTSVYYEDGYKYLGTRTLIALPKSEKDDYHILEEDQRIDQVAWKYYRDSRLWWIIAEVNSILNPLSIPKGKKLRIPSYSNVLRKVEEK